MNALTGFKIPKDGWTTQQLRASVGRFAVTVLLTRFSEGRDITDGSAAPYSPRGPVYLSLGASRKHSIIGAVPAHIRQDAERRYKTSSRKSLKFENYSAMKQYLGYPAYRNLKLSGDMLGSIAVTSNTPQLVTIGFKDSLQEKKMRGNQKHSPSWAFSDNDQAKIRAMWEHTMGQRFQEVMKRLVAGRTK